MMNDRLTIQAPPTEKDAAGQVVGGWTSLPDIWADFRFQTGAEVLRGGLSVATVRVTARVWQRNDIDNTMRAVHKSVAYDIKAVLPDSKDRRFMFLVCESAK